MPQVQRDVPDIARIRSLDVLTRLLSHAAAQTATLFNLSGLAAPFQVSRPTIRDYVTLLEQVFLLEELPPWHSNRLSRLVKTPKLHLGDTGLACTLLGVDASGLAADRSLLGQLLETFVYQELRRQATWHESLMSFFHFRDKDGVEVDIVIERGAQALAGVEVKASATVTASDFRGLQKCGMPQAAASRGAWCSTTVRPASALATGSTRCRCGCSGRRHEDASPQWPFGRDAWAGFGNCSEPSTNPNST